MYHSDFRLKCKFYIYLFQTKYDILELEEHQSHLLDILLSAFYMLQISLTSPMLLFEPLVYSLLFYFDLQIVHD